MGLNRGFSQHGAMGIYTHFNGYFVVFFGQNGFKSYFDGVLNGSLFKKDSGEAWRKGRSRIMRNEKIRNSSVQLILMSETILLDLLLDLIKKALTIFVVSA